MIWCKHCWQGGPIQSLENIDDKSRHLIEHDFCAKCVIVVADILSRRRELSRKP